jgi:hypothetical protein
MLWRVGEEIPARLMLVLPARLGAASTLRMIARGVQEVRNDFAERAQRWKAECDRAQAEGDQLRQAMWHGMTMTWCDAAELIDQDLFVRFGLFGQIEASEPPPPENTASTAERLDLDVDRPQFPLPEVGGRLGRLVSALVGQRVQMVSLAVLERSLAQDWERQARELDEDAEECPHFRAHYSRAITWAMGADRIDAALAEAFGLQAEYQTFLAMYGPWLGRIA